MFELTSFLKCTGIVPINPRNHFKSCICLSAILSLYILISFLTIFYINFRFNKTSLKIVLIFRIIVQILFTMYWFYSDVIKSGSKTKWMSHFPKSPVQRFSKIIFIIFLMCYCLIIGIESYVFKDTDIYFQISWLHFHLSQIFQYIIVYTLHLVVVVTVEKYSSFIDFLKNNISNSITSLTSIIHRKPVFATTYRTYYAYVEVINDLFGWRIFFALCGLFFNNLSGLVMLIFNAHVETVNNQNLFMIAYIFQILMSLVSFKYSYIKVAN